AKVRYLDEAIDGETARVQTAMVQRNGGELRLDYHLVDRGGAWKIRDVSIDGVSLMANYRAPLDRVLGAASFADPLSHMRAKVCIVDAPETSTPAAAVAGPAEPEGATPDPRAPIPIVSVTDVPPPAPELRLATYDPAFRVPERVDAPLVVATTPPSRPAGE